MLRHFLLPFFLLAASALFAQSSQPTDLTIESIASGNLTGRPPESVEWSPDGSKLTYIDRTTGEGHGELWEVDAATGEKKVLVSETKLSSLAPAAAENENSNERQREWNRRYGVAAYKWSPDSKYLLFDSNGQFWLYTFQTGTAVQATSSPDPSSDPKFSPDDKHLAYVRKHDLWIRDIPDGDERQLTKHNDEDDLLNGEVDWVYAEELGVRSNYFWSPDSKQIAFLQMDEKKVPEYPIVSFAGVHAKEDDQKYPQPGDPNPDVRVGVMDISSGHAHWITLPGMNTGYVPRFGWLKSGVLWIEVLDRSQQKMTMYFVDAHNANTKVAFTETSDVWVSEREEIYWFKSGDRLLLPSWRDGHTHLYLYSWDKDNPLSGEAKLVRQVTKGDYEVSKIDFVDESAGVVYYTAEPADSANLIGALQHQIFSAKVDGSEVKQVSQQAGTHDAIFGTRAEVYLDRYSSLMQPPQLSLCHNTGQCTPFWQSKDISAFHLAEPQTLQLKAADGTTTLYAHLYMPLGTMDTATRFPVLLNPYGGPTGQMVRDAWGGNGFLLHEYLARKGFAVLVVDNRGMGSRGRQFSAWLKNRFGKIELADQLAALDQVLKRYPKLDPNKIGWFGGSYGGYMTIYAMTHSDRIAAGVAMAPVTDWRLYDSIYTERYLGQPEANEEGYKTSSPTNDGANLHGALLIIHGTSDDNVHIANSVQIAQALIKAGKQFDMMLYPAQTHGVTGPTAVAHEYHLIEDHFTRMLKPGVLTGGLIASP